MYNFGNFYIFERMGTILLKSIIVDGAVSDILIEDGLIRKIAPSFGDGIALRMPASGIEVVDCRGKAAVPGFINMHTHAGMSLMRGIGEDIIFHDWLERIWKVEEKIDDEYVYHATKVACLEMIKTGTTTFCDHYWRMPMAHEAAVGMGLRPVLAYVLCDKNECGEAEKQAEQCIEMYETAKSWNDESVFTVAMHAIYSVSEQMLVWAAEFARKNGLRMHIHVSETAKEVSECMAEHGGLSPVEYLDRLGVLGPDVIAAHTLHLSGNDIRILGERGVNCVHNINSNLKLASGYKFMYNELRDAGANVCLGTDGCASSNNLDMLETMKTSAMVQKAWRGDPSAMPLDELLAMATCNGGKALGLNAGRIEEGAAADLLIVDTENYNFLSPGSFLANFIYSAHSDCISSVIRGGRFVMRNRIVKGEKEILAEAGKMLEKLK